jgi:hypothetical protein
LPCKSMPPYSFISFSSLGCILVYCKLLYCPVERSLLDDYHVYVAAWQGRAV